MSQPAMRLLATVFAVFQVQFFAVLLLADGYSLGTALAAASAIAAISAEIAARLLSGDGPGATGPLGPLPLPA